MAFVQFCFWLISEFVHVLLCWSFFGGIVTCLWPIWGWISFSFFSYLLVDDSFTKMNIVSLEGLT